MTNEQRTSADFAETLRKFVEIAQSIIDERWTGKESYKPTLSIDPNGRKYARIVRKDPASRSVFCFVDMTNGDILKSASWNTPAKHARGNIYNNNPENAITEYGAKYLR